MSKPLKKAIAYVRVSTYGQEENGHGLELQRTKIEAFAQHEGYEIVEFFRDAHTGKDAITLEKRPGAWSAFRRAKEMNWTIIVDDLSRISRNTDTLQKIIAEGRLPIISATDGVGISPSAQAAQAARAQRERELISISTKRALQKLKGQGVRLGNTKNLPEAQAKAVVANKAKTEKLVHGLLPDIQELRRAGKKTAQEIADGLNERGRRTPRGELWKATNIRRVLGRVDELAGAQKLGEKAKRYDNNPLWGAF